MEIKEIRKFTQSMIQIENFLSELAARYSELRYIGLSTVKLWDSYQKASDSFNDFDRNLYELIKFTESANQRYMQKILYMHPDCFCYRAGGDKA